MKTLTFGVLAFVSFQFAIPAQEQMPKELKIVVVQGEGAINNVRRAAASEPVIVVEDENQKPVVGATVVFTLPTEGTTGQFGSGAQRLTVLTDAQGRATAAGLKVNEYPGKLVIEINVSYRGLAARTSITQFDEGPPVNKPQASRGGHGKLIVILVVVAAAAGGGAYALSSRGSSSTPAAPATPAIGLSAGTPTIIGPH